MDWSYYSGKWMYIIRTKIDKYNTICSSIYLQCSLVGIGFYVFTDENPQSELLKRDELIRVYWFETRFLSLEKREEI